MGHRERILVEHGYTVQYHEREIFRGGPKKVICTAQRDGIDYFVSKDQSYCRIVQKRQPTIPHMALIHEVIDDVVVVNTAPGKMLWDFDSPPDAERVERQLLAFANGASLAGLVHSDVRPWNIFFDDACGTTVIDWSHAIVLSELRLEYWVLSHLKETQHDKMKLSDIDAEDGRRCAQLIRGRIGLQEAWGYGISAFPKRPKWCHV